MGDEYSVRVDAATYLINEIGPHGRTPFGVIKLETLLEAHGWGGIESIRADIVTMLIELEKVGAIVLHRDRSDRQTLSASKILPDLIPDALLGTSLAVVTSAEITRRQQGELEQNVPLGFKKLTNEEATEVLARGLRIALSMHTQTLKQSELVQSARELLEVSSHQTNVHLKPEFSRFLTAFNLLAGSSLPAKERLSITAYLVAFHTRIGLVSEPETASVLVNVLRNVINDIETSVRLDPLGARDRLQFKRFSGKAISCLRKWGYSPSKINEDEVLELIMELSGQELARHYWLALNVGLHYLAKFSSA